jgi:hypothetical protein
MKIKNNQIQALIMLIPGLSIPPSVEIPVIMGIVNLAEEIKKLSIKLDKSTELLFKAYKIEPNEDGSYSWANHEKQKEIAEKYSQLLKVENEVIVDFPKDPELYVKIGNGLKVGQLLLLKEILT